MIRGRFFLCVLVFLFAAPGTPAAQTFEAVGNRAQGMGGAFVAVADDATATWWNPAGLATLGAPSVLFEIGKWTDPADHAPAGPVIRNHGTAVAMSLPGIGLSYYRINLEDVWPLVLPDQEPGPAPTGLRRFVLNQYAATTGRSIGGIIAISTTAKLVQVGGADAVSVAIGDRLDEAHDLDVPTDTKGDIDFGALALVGPIRIGYTLKHVLQPKFETVNGSIVLERQSRIGAAFKRGASAAGAGLTIAFDADLTTTPTRVGDVKHMAVGAEAGILRWVGVRGGLSWNTIGESRTSWSGGLSLGASGYFVDGAMTFGSDKSKEGWTIGVRLPI